MTQAINGLWLYSESNPMLFTQGIFWIFLVVVLFGYAWIYRNLTLRHLYLFLVSLFFYYKSGGLFLFLLIISIVTDYSAGIQIHKTTEKWKKRGWVIFSLFINLGLLAYFKYTFFFIGLLQHIPGVHLLPENYLSQLSNQWFHTHFDVSHILLPVGISFYTFQTISYTLDIYRGKIHPLRKFTDFAFYVSFFPQLVAGPIVRAAQFIPQLKKKFHLSRDEFGHALFLILSGLIKKIVLADMLAYLLIDKVFDQPAAYSGLENLMAWYGYGLQIFCDFSGYTDIAIGVALLFGFRIPINFNAPYKAVSLTDFWRRWHISLSSWLRDYLYIPLGGNRKGGVRSWINILITMILGGLWHGANLRFLLWGTLHGLGLVTEKIFHRIIPALHHPGKKGRFLSRFFTFHVVTMLWIFFRAPDLATVRSMVHQVFHSWRLPNLVAMLGYYREVIFLIFVGYLLHWIPSQWQENTRGWFIKRPLWIKFLIALFVAFFLIQVKNAGFKPFIYFRF